MFRVNWSFFLKDKNVFAVQLVVQVGKFVDLMLIVLSLFLCGFIF